MPRRPGGVQGGMVFHAINRGNCGMPVFEKDQDYLGFAKHLEEGWRRVGMRIVAYCVMGNHWHLVLNV
jgi:putative transposase